MTNCAISTTQIKGTLKKLRDIAPKSRMPIIARIRYMVILPIKRLTAST